MCALAFPSTDTAPVRCQCLGTRARTCAIDTAAADAIERTRNSIDAARLVAAAVAIMTPSKLGRLVGLARLAGPTATI